MVDFSYDHFDGFYKLNDIDFIDSLEAAKSNLSVNDSFAYFDLKLSNDDITLFDQLVSEPSKEGCWFDGCLDCNDTQDQIQALADCIAKASSNDMSVVNKAANTVSKIANDVKLALGNPHDYTLVQFRVLYNSLNSDTYVNQDWHTDDLYSDFAHRVVITFKGNPTDFYNLHPDDRSEYNDLSDLYVSGQNYSAFQDFINPDLISHAGPGQGAIFTNLDNNAAVHAIPKTGGEPGSTRVVLIVDVASKEVMELHNNKIIEDGGVPHFINQTPKC